MSIITQLPYRQREKIRNPKPLRTVFQGFGLSSIDVHGESKQRKNSIGFIASIEDIQFDIPQSCARSHRFVPMSCQISNNCDIPLDYCW